MTEPTPQPTPQPDPGLPRIPPDWTAPWPPGRGPTATPPQPSWMDTTPAHLTGYHLSTADPTAHRQAHPRAVHGCPWCPPTTCPICPTSHRCPDPSGHRRQWAGSDYSLLTPAPATLGSDFEWGTP